MENLSNVLLLISCLVGVFLLTVVHTVNATTDDPLRQLGEMLGFDNNGSNISDEDEPLANAGPISNTTRIDEGSISAPPSPDTRANATYENEHVGLKLEYPSTWIAWGEGVDNDDCKPGSMLFCGGWLSVNATGGLGPEGVKLFFLKDVHGQHDCNCDNLTDYLRYKHKKLVETADESSTTSNFHYIDDNQTTILKDNHSAWQLQYGQKEMDEDDFTSHNTTSVYWITKINDTFYQFEFETSIGENFTKYYPVAKSIIDSVEFIPITPEKIPSFMSATDDNKLDNQEKSTEPVRIVGLSSFLEPNSIVGNMIVVVGEVHNDSPETLTSVSTAITLYDSGDNVIGTDTTYTRPSSIAPDSSAPFKFTIFGDSIRGGANPVEDYKVSVSSR